MRRPLLLLLLASCSEGLSYDEYVDKRIDALCEQDVRCGLFASMSDCRVEALRTRPDNPNTAAAIAAGTTSYDADAAEACLEVLAKLSCDWTEQTSDDFSACDDVLTGTGDAGNACAFDIQCKSDRCQRPDCEMACCTGVCAPEVRSLPSVGEPCSYICVEGAFCNAESICQALLPAGAACGPGSAECAYGLYCAGATSSGSGSCAAVPHLGESCEYVCAETAVSCRSGTCQLAGLPGDACSSGTCAGAYDCVDGVCTTYPGLGEPCAVRCSGNAWCDMSSFEGGVCVAQQPNRSPCLRAEECASHYCTDEGSGKFCDDVPMCI